MLKSLYGVVLFVYAKIGPLFVYIKNIGWKWRNFAENVFCGSNHSIPSKNMTQGYKTYMNVDVEHSDRAECSTSNIQPGLKVRPSKIQPFWLIQ